VVWVSILTSIESDLRRRLLKVIGAFFLAVTLPAAPASAETLSSTAKRRTFAAFLNILIPRDVYTGSASDLKVDRRLWAFAARDPRFSRLIDLGCLWLDMTGTGGFADLSIVDRNTVVEWMANSDWNQIPRRFYELVRQLAVEIYYSNPDSLGGLPIKTPPQPLGYPPPWQ
jgi:hypothetical protein